MTDDYSDRGLGWVESPPDDRDYPLTAAYDALGLDVPDALPASYRVPAPLPAVLDQGSTPMCVAYSAAGEQLWFDLRDSGSFTPDEPLFFKWIGGTANGAIIRDALSMRLSTGYPPKAQPTEAGRHRIAAYYAVPVDADSLKAAILTFGPVVIGTPWYRRWFAPVGGVLGTPDTVVGGHAILGVGWNAVGLRLRNSWGADWGDGGEATLPWAQLHYLREAWKAVDVKTAPVKYSVKLSRPEPTYRTPNGAPTGTEAGAYTYTCTRSKHGGLWWYEIVGPARTTHLREWMKPDRTWTVEVAK